MEQKDREKNNVFAMPHFLVSLCFQGIGGNDGKFSANCHD